MYRNSFIVLVIMVLTGLLFSAFQKTDVEPEVLTVEDLIRQEVEERVLNFKRRSLERCQGKIMERASEMTDSILIARARVTTIIDSIQKPPKPKKPEKPAVPVVQDTTPVKPLLKESGKINFD